MSDRALARRWSWWRSARGVWLGSIAFALSPLGTELLRREELGKDWPFCSSRETSNTRSANPCTLFGRARSGGSHPSGTASILQLCSNRAAATGAGASGAAEAVIASHDFPAFELIRCNIPEKERLALTVALVATGRCAVRTPQRGVPTIPLHAELLIEIAIVNLTAPADADCVATHQTVNSGGVKCLN